MSEALVTVIVTAFNAESTLRKLLNSLINQQCLFNYEILVVDDGSSDDTVQIAKGFKKVKVLKKKHSGVSETRNYALKHIESEFVTFVDADDYVNSDYLKTLVAPYIEDNEVDLSICGYYKENADGRVILEGKGAKGALSKNEVLRNIFISTGFEGFLWNKLFKTELIQKNHLRFDRNVKLAEDLLFCCEYCNYINKAYENNKPTYHYVMRESSALNSSLKIGRRYSEESLNILFSYSKIADVIPNDDRVQEAFNVQLLWNCISLLRVIYGAPNKEAVSVRIMKSLRSKVRGGTIMFLRSDIFPIKDKLIYVFVLICPKFFTFLWIHLGLQGNAN